MLSRLRQFVRVGVLLGGGGLCLPLTAGGTPVSSPAPFLIRSWQTDQGLPNNTINAIAQTRDGYLWMGTDNGLVRFDGVRCKGFGLQDGLGSLHISALLEDSRGDLWIGTAGGGLSRLANGSIETFTVTDGLVGNSIHALLEAPNGEVWAGSPTGLSCWRNGRFETVAGNLGSIYVFGMAKDRRGNIWAATLHNGLLRFQDGKVSTMPVPDGTAAFNPFCVLVDRNDRVWVGLREKYVACYDAGNWTRYGTNDGLPEIAPTRLAQTPDGGIWVALLNGGLHYLQDGKFSGVRIQDGLTDSAILSLFSDSHFLWVGTQAGGLCRLGPIMLSVYHALEDSSESTARSLAQTKDGELWLGTLGHGLYRWHGGAIQPMLGRPISDHLNVEAVLAGRDRSLWWGAGPVLYQWRDGKLLFSFAEGWLVGDRVWSLCEDRTEGMWVGTYNGQLQFLKQGKFTPVGGLPARPVTALAQETDGTLWIGTLGGGLARLQNDKLTIFTTRDGLRGNLIRALWLDSEGTLWIGIAGGGLVRRSKGEFFSFTSHQGLIDDTVLQIVEDDDDSLWLGCNRGICRVHKRMLNEVAEGRTAIVPAFVIGRSDGMPSESCVGNFGAALKTHDGRICFLTAKGIVFIDPRSQTKKEVPPVVLLEDILVNGRALADAPQKKHPKDEGFKISPGRRSFEFHYTGVNFDAPERIRFKHQLEGLDSDWIDAGHVRVAHYSSVPPGRYRFLVQASNGNEIWRSNVAEQFFIVLPHFWQTAWFRVLAAALILGGGGLSIRFVELRRYRSRLKRLEQERALGRERERIARDLHDELGSSLTYISMSVSDLGRACGPDAEALRVRLEKMSHFAVRTARSLDEIVWAVNPKNDSLRSLVEYLTQLVRELFEDTNIRCRFHISESLPQLPLPPEIRHNVFLAVKEALNNTLKHAHASEVLLGASMVGRQIEFVVQDNGAGFDPPSTETDGERNGLDNMRQRIESFGGRFALETKPGAGTRITLALDCPAGHEPERTPPS